MGPCVSLRWRQSALTGNFLIARFCSHKFSSNTNAGQEWLYLSFSRISSNRFLVDRNTNGQREENKAVVDELIQSGVGFELY